MLRTRGLWASAMSLGVSGWLCAQQPPAVTMTTPEAPAGLSVPGPQVHDQPLPINLPTALQLAGVRPLDIAAASARIRAAAAELERAKVLWLPTLYLGGDYARHDGRLQDVAGNFFDTSKSSLMAGAGPSAVFALSDALFAPLAARQTVRAREAALQTARNDSLLAVAEAYFDVQQARGELAGDLDAARRADEVVRQAGALAQAGTVSPVEVVRARTEVARRRQVVQAARERWRTASADLARLLRLGAADLVEPEEPPQLLVTLVRLERPVDDLIPVALMNRPELAEQQALVRATLERLKQEKMRPLVPSILLRGNATNPAGALAAGAFGGGRNDQISQFGARNDLDLQVLWELQNLGLGNRARVRQQRAEHELSLVELMRTQDRVAAEVVQAFAQAQSAATRLGDAESEVKDAVESAAKNLQGLTETGATPPSARTLALLVRPQEVVASVQALAQAYGDYYGTVGDYNRAQFRLYRALGQPAQFVTDGGVRCPLSSGSP